MRLWSEQLIKKLPRQQLLGQHREIAALRGKGWRKPHSTINYIFNYDLSKLYDYHCLIMEEMLDRGYNVSEEWLDHQYRGKLLGYDKSIKLNKTTKYPIYPEHNENYLKECIDNLKSKGIEI